VLPIIPEKQTRDKQRDGACDAGRSLLVDGSSEVGLQRALVAVAVARDPPSGARDGPAPSCPDSGSTGASTGISTGGPCACPGNRRHGARLGASAVLALRRPSWSSRAERNQDSASSVLKGYRLDASTCFGVVLNVGGLCARIAL
jgi:hypothetical protein